MNHKWHKEIKAWAGGAEIEVSGDNGIWYCSNNPSWDIDLEYRIKPQDICKCQKQTCSALKEKKYFYVYQSGWDTVFSIDKRVSNQFYLGKIEVLDD